MRAAIAFFVGLCIAGLASTDFAWKAGYTYTYDVRGRVLTGLGQHTQYSGLEVEYQMLLTVVGPDTINLKPTNFKIVELNDDMDGGWRDGVLSDKASPVQIKGQLKEYLESPMEMQMRQGVVDSIKVDGRLPTWAVNMKKAQASHFILDTTGVNVVVSGNLKRKSNDNPAEANHESGFFYETMEQTVHGECETYYTVSQNGPFDTPFQFQKQAQPVQDDDSSSNENDARSQQQNSGSSESSEETEANRHKYYDNFQQYATYKKLAQNMDSASAEDSHETIQGELPWPKAFKKFCNQGDQIYEIVKSVNFTTCRNKPVLVYSTATGLSERFGDNSMGSTWERTVNTRYLACGRNRRQYTILNVIQDEQTNTGYRLEQRILAGSVQNLTLSQIQKANKVDQVQNPKQIHDLTYTFDPKEQQLQQQGQLQHAFAAADIFEENDDDNNDSNESQQRTSTYSPRRHYSQEQQSRQQESRESEQDSSSQSQEQQQNYKYSKTQRQSDRRRNNKSRKPRSITDSQESSEESHEQYGSNEVYHTDAEDRKFLRQPSLTRPPLSQMLISGLQTDGMRNRVVNLMKEIVNDILNVKQSMAETETISKITTVARILRRLPYNENEKLYHELAFKAQTDEQQTSRNVFLDALAMSGNNPSIKLLFDLIQKKEIKGEEAAQILSAMPLSIRTPTQQIAKEFYQLVDSEALEYDRQVKTTAILAFSKFLHQAYVNTRIQNSRYPVQVYGQFGDAKFVQRTFVPYFIKNLEKHLTSGTPADKHWITVYLNALGNLGVQDVVPAVQKILDDFIDPYIKTQAVFALKGLLLSRQAENIPVEGQHSVDRDSQDFLTDKFIESQVLPILVAVSFDRGEHPSVRMSAISLLLFSTDADVNIWQQLAYSTWFAASQEVHAFIYTSLQNLAHVKGQVNSRLWPMVKKARTVFSLAKPIVPGYAKSHNTFASFVAEHVQSNFAHQFQYFGAKDSNVPQYMYYRNFVQHGNGGVRHSPLEVSVHGHTIQKLVDYFVEQVQEQLQGKKPAYQQAHPEYLAMRQILGLTKRQQDEEIEGSIQFTINNEIQRIFSFNEQKIKDLIKYAQGRLFPSLKNGLPFNHQKTFHYVEHNVEYPSGLGIPISFSHRIPVHLSLRGNIKVVKEDAAQDYQVVAEVHAVYGWKQHTRLAFKAPFVGKQYQAGVQRHMVIELPLRASVRLAPQGQLVFAITPAQLQKGNPSGEIDLVTYHQRPYTIIISDNLWPASHKEGGKMELIRTAPSTTQQTPYKRTHTFGEDLFGLSFRVDEESDYQQESERVSQWAKLWKSFHSSSCFFNLGWMGSQQIRFAERTLTIDIAKSQTKTLALIYGGKIHRNAQYKALWQDSSSQSSQSSEESASSESAQDSSSQQQSAETRFGKQQTRASRRDNNDSAQQSSEDQSQSGLVFAFGLIGKRIPIRSAQEFRSVQKILDHTTPSTVQYIFQFSKSNGRVYIRGASGEAANEAATTLPRSSESLQALSQAVHDAPNAQAQQDGCFEFEGEYELPKEYEQDQLLVLRKKLLADELAVKVKGELQFGKSCKGMPHEIKVVGKLQRGQQMTEYAQKSLEAQKCQEDEKKGFSVSPVCIRVAEQQAAALNRGQFKIQYSELPEAFRNMTYNAEDFIKTLFYPYMSHDRTHQGAGEGQAQLSFRMTPNKQFFNVELIKSNSRITFEDVKTNRYFQTLLPITATQSFPQNIADRLFRADSQPSCTLESNYVNTFDNVTYRFSSQVAEGCYHVLAKDCSEKYPVAVLVKDIAAQQNEVTIFLAQKTKVQLIPQGKRRLNKSKLQVKINGQTVESLPKSLRDQQSNEPIVYIEQMYDGGVQVFSEHFNVASNGQYVAVYASNYLRNKTCGLCGDFNGEKVADMKSPKNCPLSSGSALVASYAYQSGEQSDRSQCKIDSEIKRQIQEEERQCLTDESYFNNSPRKYWSEQASRDYARQYGDNTYPSSASRSLGQQDEQCFNELSPAIRKALQDSLNPILKARVWSTEKRQKYADKIIQKVMNQQESWLNQGSSDKIARAVASQVCDAFRSTSLSSNIVSYLCRVSKSYLVNALKLEINPVCDKSECCNKIHLAENEKILLKSDISYIMADSAESDETDIPYVNHGSKSKIGCQKMISKHLEASLPKQVYLYLQDEETMSRNQIKTLVDNYKQRIPKAVQKTFTRANQLADNLIEAINDAFGPQAQQVAHKLHQLVREYVSIVVKQMHRTTNGECNFAKYDQN